MTTSLSAEAHVIAEAIVAEHAPRFAGGAPGRPAAQADPGADANSSAGAEADSVYRGARQAARTLGFIDIDADCIARAWQARSRRTARFDAREWPADPVDFGLRPFPPNVRADAFPACPQALGLYAVLPDADWVARMARAGVPTVQLRFKSSDGDAVRAQVRAAVAAVRGTPARLFINDHWQAAIEAGAYGVHLGQEDLDALPPEDLARLRASGLRLGVSTHGYAEMLRADAVSPSYLALGAVYPTTLKQMATAPQGTARLAAYAQLMRGYPLVGIGGIDEARLPEVLATGVGSVAVVRALVADPAPEAAARRLLHAVSTRISTL